MTNPGRSVPGMVSPPEQAHYYQPSIHQSYMSTNVEDVRFRKIGIPGMQYEATGMLTGIPGSAHHDLLQPHSHTSTPGPPDEIIQVDPQLLAYDHGQVERQEDDNSAYNHHLGMWQVPPGHGHYMQSAMLAEAEQYPPQQSFHPGMQTLTDGRDSWNMYQEESQGDAGTEFDKWFHSTGY
jgi:hypothetical protein